MYLFNQHECPYNTKAAIPTAIIAMADIPVAGSIIIAPPVLFAVEDAPELDPVMVVDPVPDAAEEP